MATGLDLFSVARITRIRQGLQDVRTLPQSLLFLNRTQRVDAVDGELTGRYLGQTTMADLVADDARATVKAAGRIQWERTLAPNIKHGRMMTQAMMAQVDSLTRGGGLPNDAEFISNYVRNEQVALSVGTEQRMEQLLVAMLIDAFSYNALGIQITNATWGMPSDLKVTPSNPWTDAVNATPINDILVLIRLAEARYGQRFNTVTMSLSALNLVTATAEFQSRARFVLMPGQAVSMLPLNVPDYAKGIIGNLLGMTVETYDARAWSQTPDGTIFSSPYLPLNKVLLTNSDDYNDPAAWDFSNGVVTESLVDSIANTNVVGKFAGPMRGPVGYATAPPDLNPPNLTFWDVYRGWPRKNRLQSSAVLTIGNVTELISTAVPFPA